MTDRERPYWPTALSVIVVGLVCVYGFGWYLSRLFFEDLGRHARAALLGSEVRTTGLQPRTPVLLGYDTVAYASVRAEILSHALDDSSSIILAHAVRGRDAELQAVSTYSAILERRAGAAPEMRLERMQKLGGAHASSSRLVIRPSDTIGYALTLPVVEIRP